MGWSEYDAATHKLSLVAPSGAWSLWCQGSDGSRYAFANRQIIVENSGITGIQLRWRLSFQMSGGVRILRIDPPTDGAAPEADIYTGVPPGKYRVAVDPQTCAAALLTGNTDLLREDLIVANDVAPAPVRFVRYKTCPTLSVMVHSQSGDPWGRVVLVSDSDHIEPEVVPFNSGKFDTPGLIPGTYHVYAFRSIDDLEYANPAALRDFPGQTVHLQENQHAAVDLELIQKR